MAWAGGTIGMIFVAVIINIIIIIIIIIIINAAL